MHKQKIIIISNLNNNNLTSNIENLQNVKILHTVKLQKVMIDILRI